MARIAVRLERRTRCVAMLWLASRCLFSLCHSRSSILDYSWVEFASSILIQASVRAFLASRRVQRLGFTSSTRPSSVGGMVAVHLRIGAWGFDWVADKE